MNITQVVAPELADYVRQQITRTMREWFGAVCEIEIITKDHRRVALETSITQEVAHMRRKTNSNF